MKLYFFIAWWVYFLPAAKAQNLFANASFEELNICTEYNQECAPEAWFNILPAATPLFYPKSLPVAFEGKELLMVPVENVHHPAKKRQFVYSRFCCPLIKKENYKLSFYLHTGGTAFYGIDFYMRTKEFTSENFLADTARPSIHIAKEDVVSDYKGWSFIETFYTAKGNEQFCLIGNLAKDTFAFSSYQAMNRGGDVFYFIDNISFTPVKKSLPCTGYLKNKIKLYEQNLRHTERILTNENEEIKPDTLTLPGVYFETDKSILKPQFKKILDSLVRKMPVKKIKAIHVEGHTDDRGTTEKNDKLSADRATTVKLYLAEKLPLLKQYIFAEGKGENFPKADNDTDKGRAVNRRVEIILTYTY